MKINIRVHDLRLRNRPESNVTNNTIGSVFNDAVDSARDTTVLCMVSYMRSHGHSRD